MNREEIIRTARGAGAYCQHGDFNMGHSYEFQPDQLERFAALVAAAECNKLAAWMIQFGFATGHGDTMEELVDALGSEIVDRIEIEIDCEREACARVCDVTIPGDEYLTAVINSYADTIRARGNI